MVLLCVSALRAAGQGLNLSGSLDGGESPAVTARFLSDANAIQPGGSVRVGVLLTMADDWHVYWRNPGDAGLATDLSLKLPEGWTASPMRWPTPVRFAQAGGIVGYGYEKTVLLWRTVTAGPKAPIGETVSIAARVDWLACRVECVPGKAAGSVGLRVRRRPADGNATSADARTFAAWQKRRPIVPADANAPVSVQTKLDLDDARNGSAVVTLSWTDANAPKELAWFPPADRAVSWGEPAFRRSGKTARMTVTVRGLKGQTPARRTLVGLVAWRDSDRQHRSVRIPLPIGPVRSAAESDNPSKKSPASTQAKGSSP
jgi:thiol:disulfide interchange protein DsbD